MELTDIVGFLQELARDAGSIMMAKRGSPIQSFRKSDKSFVTEVDLAISAMVIARVKAFAPHWGLLTEETCKGKFLLAEEGLIVDELDGTNGYLHGQSGFTFQCAYYRRRELLVAVIFDPLTDHLLFGIKGQGVHLVHQDTTTRVPAPIDKEWRNLRFAHHRQYMTNTIRKMYASMGIPQQNIIQTGGIGSKCLDFVLGRVDVVVALNRRVAPWDWAPGKVILEELGYSFTHLTGAPVVLFDEPSDLAFGFLVCPPAHQPKFLTELTWITKKVLSSHSFRQIGVRNLIHDRIRGNLSA